MKDEIMWAWIAGFIDGEGSIGLAREHDYRKGPNYVHYRPSIQISNTHRGALLDLQLMLGDGFLSKAVRHPNKNSRTQYHFALRHGNALIHVLTKIIPYLRIKRTQAVILRSYLAMRQTTPFLRGWYKPTDVYVHNFYNCLRFLNRVGKQAEGCHHG